MNKSFITFVILVIIFIGGYFLLKSPEAQAPTQVPNTNSENSSTSAGNKVEKVVSNMVTYTDAGYSPSTLTVKVGTTVTFKNMSSASMWTASAMHPSHTAYSGTSLSEHCPDVSGTAFDECGSAKPGDSWSFIFNKVGTWKYHNHVNTSHFGTIVVQ